MEDKLIEAVRALYYAGVWHCDRPVDEAALWEAVRDAAGFEPGHSPEPSSYLTGKPPERFVAFGSQAEGGRSIGGCCE